MSYTEPSFDTDFLIEVKKGNIPGHSLVHKFGRNAAVPNGSWQFVNLLGFTAWPLSLARTVRIKAGGDITDTALGNGAREITVQGIAADLSEQTETIATAGLVASAATSLQFWRVHRAWVSAIGTYGSGNTGAVTIENNAGTLDLIQIAAGEGQSQFTAFTIPAGKYGYLLSVDVTVNSGKPADIKLMTREDMNITSGADMKSVRLKKQWDGITGAMPPYRPRSPDVKMQPLTDVWIEARGSGATTKVSANMEVLLVDV